MINSYYIEDIIVEMAREKHDSRIKCFCEEQLYQTICLSFDEIKLKCNELRINFNDYESLFCFGYKKSWYNCFPQFYVPIINQLKKRIKYESFSRYRTKVKKVYISDYDGFFIVFELKK